MTSLKGMTGRVTSVPGRLSPLANERATGSVDNIDLEVMRHVLTPVRRHPPSSRAQAPVPTLSARRETPRRSGRTCARRRRVRGGSGVPMLVHGRVTLIRAAAGASHGRAVTRAREKRGGHRRSTIMVHVCSRARAPVPRHFPSERAMTSSRRATSRAGCAQTARIRLRRALRRRDVRVASRYGCSSPIHLLPGVTRMCAARDTVVRRA